MRIREARRLILQILYTLFMSGNGFPEDYEEYCRRVAEGVGEERVFEEFKDFVLGRVKGVWEKREELDAVIEEFSEEWRVERLHVPDRIALWIGIWEMLNTSLPPEIVANEAVELAKRFGLDSSGQFVNGILRSVYERYRKGREEDAGEGTGERRTSSNHRGTNKGV